MTLKSLVSVMTGRQLCRACAAITFTCMFAVVMNAQEQPKRYDLSLDWKNPVVGHKSEVSQDDSQAMMLKMLTSDGKVLQQHGDNHSRSFAAVEVVNKVEGGKETVLRWTFSKATQHQDDQDVPFDFQGRTVVVTKDSAGKSQFAFDDGKAVSSEDATVLAGLWDSDTKPGEPSGEEIFQPKSPVAVGEEWTPDITLMAQSLSLESGSIDLKRSSAKAMLKSTEMRDGAEFGHIVVSFELWVMNFGPLELDQPIPMKMAGDLDVCIDHSQPDGVMNLTFDAKGLSTAHIGSPPTAVQISLDVDGKIQMRQKTIK